jgi:CDP-paratose 2-epimerase
LEFRRILITGGAGFVGSNLAIRLKQAFADLAVTVFDNLRRRGSELNLPRLKQHGVAFRHGDIRCREDFAQCPPFDLLMDCSADPSVQAGLDGDPLPTLANNLFGTVHCAEEARRASAAMLFISTSRVYPVQRLNDLAFREEATRFAWTAEEPILGYSAAGIAEAFPLDGWRSFYGASKLASELLLQEYVAAYRMPALVNRCGVLAGPWQMGKVDQGVVTQWVARHVFQQELAYFGYDGSGKQVRDILHVDDFFDLLCRQMARPAMWDGRTYNVGGGNEVSISLLELTELCQQQTGQCVPIHRRAAGSPADVRIYITDARRVAADFDWRPQRSPAEIVADVVAWVRTQEPALRTILA